MSFTITRKNSTNTAVTDDPTDKSEGKDTAEFFRPHKHDILPVLLGILVICLGIFAGLLSYFLLKNADYANAQQAMVGTATDAGATLTEAIKASVNVVQSVSSFFSVSPVTLYQDQFKTFVYAGGSMPKYLLGVTKLRTIKPEETDAFQAQMRSLGGIYANYSITSRDTSNNVVYPAVWSPLRCVATNIVPESVFAAGIGYDVSTETLRNTSMYKTFATNQPVGTGRVSTVLATGTLNVAVVIFFRTYNYTTNQNDGMIAGTLLMSQLIQETLAPTVAQGVIVSVHDLNATSTDVNKGFLLATNNATLSQNTQNINDARYTQVVNVPFADRMLKLTLFPGPTYQARFDGSNKWVALALSFFFGLVLLVGCVFLFCGRRLYALRKSKIASNVQIDLLKTNQVALRTLLDRIANQEQKTRAVINALPDYVCVISATGKIMQTNASFDQVFPFTETEMERGIYTWDIFTELSSDFFRISDENKEIVTVASRRFGDYLDVTVRVRSLSKDSQSSTSEQSNQIARSNTNIPLPELEEAYVIICKGSLEVVNPVSIEEQSLRNELEKRLRDHVFRQDFKEFCEKNQTSENLLFLEKLREYKKSNFGVRVDMKQSIFETFIKHEAPMQLNLANDVIVEESIKISKSIADVDVFKRVEDCVMKTLTGDVYPRFVTNRKGSFVLEK